MFIENTKIAQLRAKIPSPSSAEKKTPPLGNFRRFLLAGPASLMLFSSCAKVDAPPIVKFIPPTNREEYMQLNYDRTKFLPIPFMKIQQRDGFCIAYENDSIKTNAERLAVEIEKYQGILPIKSKVGLAIVSNDFGDRTFNNDIVSLQVQDNWIYARGNAPAFSSEKRLAWSVFHEISHLYMDYSLDSAANSLIEARYLSMMKLSKLPTYDKTIPPLKVDRHPLIGLFDESAYLKGADPIYGHPAFAEWELFASASTVLKFNHEEFFARVGRLKTNKRNRALYAAAMDFARLTVALWRDVKVFPDAVYTNLGLSVPVPEPQPE
jgi:hypothetical protein